MARWTVIITSGRPSTAEILARLVFKHGGEALYLPLVKVEENPPDVNTVLEAIRWSEAVLFMTGQSAWGLAEMLKGGGAVEEARRLLRERIVICRGAKASGNAKANFGVDCPNLGETSDELLRVVDRYVAGRRLLVSFYGVIDEDLLQSLSRIAREVRYIQAYRTEAAGESNALEIARRLLEGGHIVVFTSAVGASVFFTTAERNGLLRQVVEALNGGKSLAAVIGPVTEEEVRKWGVQRVVKPEKPFLAYLAEEIAKILRAWTDN